MQLRRKTQLGWLAVGSLLLLLVQWHGIKTNLKRPRNITARFTLFECNFLCKHKSLKTWNHMQPILNYSHSLSNATEAIIEASVAWDGLVSLNSVTNSSVHRLKNRTCPDFANMINDTKHDVPTLTEKELDLFIGVFSTADHFEQRMAVRRSWMQYADVKSGMVAVHFFVGLHKNQSANEAIWKEANEYDDIQLMPWVDSYTLITLKTIAICIFGSQVTSAKYIMKTDDDAFVRIDELLASLNKSNVTSGLLYGVIDLNNKPERNVKNNWYISSEEWPESKYPPFALGPGYVISRDIAMEVNRGHQNGSLKMFKLEDVALGIWIDEMKKQGRDIHYIMENEKRISVHDCKDNYMVAHYQNATQLLCLWEQLEKYKEAKCCNPPKKTIKIQI